MLPARKLRHEDQFRPQFKVLASEILATSHPADREHALHRVRQMLEANHHPTDLLVRDLAIIGTEPSDTITRLPHPDAPLSP